MTEETRLILDEIAGVRTELKDEIAGVRTELKDEIAGVKTELKDEIAGVRTELKDEIAGVKTELKDEIAGVRTELKDEINELRTTFDKRFENIEKSMDTTRFILENEIRDNIRLVAEGHLDLYRKMEEVAKTNNEKEIMFMRLKYLESEVRVIKDKFGIA